MGSKFPAGLRMRPLAVLIGVALASGMFSRQANANCDANGNDINCTGTTTTTVQVGSGGNLNVASGASISVTGQQTKAVNVIGGGNAITNNGTLSSDQMPAIWFDTGSGSTMNVIHNNGIVTTGVINSDGSLGSVIGSSHDIDVGFNNNFTGVVNGSLIFAGGDDNLNLDPGSKITGDIDGGKGNNALLLGSDVGTQDTLTSNVKNFQTLFAKGPGTWTMSGDIVQNDDGSLISIEVGPGTLVLTGANKAVGSVKIDASSTFETSAQGLLGDIAMVPDLGVTGGKMVFAQQDDATYKGKVSGIGSVTKTGAGTLTLEGDNTHTEGTKISGGTIAISKDNALGADNGALTLDGGTLQLTSSVDLSPSRAISVTANNGTIETVTGVSSTVSQGIGGDGAFVKSGAGTLTLTGNSTYIGGTTVAGGTLQLGDGNNTGSIQGDVRINEGGELVFNQPDTFTFDRLISGDGSVTQQGPGITILTDANSYTGGTTISGGTLQLGDGTVAAGGIVGDVTNNGKLAFNRANAVTFDGAISGSGSVTQLGAGTTTLTGNNSYRGGTIISNGAIAITTDSALGDAGGSLTLDGGELDLNSGIDLSPTRAIAITSRNGTIVTAGGTTSTVSQAISGDGTLLKNGGGTLTLTGNNVYQGTTIAGGKLQLGNGGTTGNITGGVLNNSILVFNRSDNVAFGNAISGIGEVVQEGSGTITLTGANTYHGGTRISSGAIAIDADGVLGDAAGAVMLDGGTLQLTSGIDLAATRAIDVTARNGTIATAAGTTSTVVQEIKGAGALTKSGAGTLTLSGDNQYKGGTTIAGGTLQVGNGGSTGHIKGNVDINAGTVLALNRSDDAFVLGGVISGDGLVVQQGTGTSTLTGVNTYTGGTSINAGTLSVAADDNLGAASGGLTFNGGTLLNTAGFTTARDISLSAGGGTFNTAVALVHTGALSGSGPLTKAGDSILTLAGNNDYSGDARVQAGTLMVNSTLGGTATVASGGSLGGVGTVAGAVTINSNGTLLGRQGQVLTFGSDLTLGSNAFINAGLGAPEATGLFEVKGDLVLDGQLNISDLGGFSAGVYRLINYDGDLTNNVLSVGTVPTGADATQIQVQTAVANQVNLINETGVTLNFWDGATVSNEDNGAVNGGDGTWTTSDQNWTAADGLVNGSWENGHFAIFQGQPGTVTVDSNSDIAVAGMQFATSGYRIQGSAITLSGTPATIRVGDGSAQSAKFTATIDSALSGSGALSKTDLGTLVLTGNNTYGGGTTITSGTLQLGNGGATGLITGNVANNGVLAFNRSDNVTFGGAISGSGAVAQLGGGTTTLTGSNSYLGGTTISNGTIAMSASADNTDSALGDSRGALTLDGGTLQLNGGVTLSPNRAVSITARNGTIATEEGTISTVTQAIKGNGALTKKGAGTLTLGGANTYSGGTTISSGTLQLGTGGTSGSIAGNVANNGVLVFNRSDNVAFDNEISGTGSVVLQGTGVTTLTGANTYSGGTTVNAGTLSVGADDNLGTPAGTLTLNGGTLVNTASFITQRGVTLSSGGGTFNTGTAFTLGGALSGNGSLTKIGDSVLTLAGHNDYDGDVDVQAGTLMVNSTLGGKMNVATGASLGGTGTVGGAATVATGAILLGQQGQVLTFRDDLALAGGSLINVELGAPESSGLFDVTGNLVLDGQLNISDLGGFGPGIYRLFNYGGSLTDNGLDIGTIPTGIDRAGMTVQTAQANEVNLVNTTGVTLHFWDGGAASNQDNGVVDGGDGTWRTGNSDWTTPDGRENGEWVNGNFAVFQGQPGTVTVDNDGVSVSGMQFSTDGYRVQGGPITLARQETIVRTGAGGLHGADVTATIASALTGTGGLTKTDLGMLVLTGNNSYTGNTILRGGTLQLGEGGATGSIAGDVAIAHNAGLVFNRSDDALVLGGTISGAGSVTQLGGGTTTLTGENTYSGGTYISKGVLQLGDGGERGSLTGQVTTTKDGALAFNRSDNVKFNGAITGAGSVIQRGSGTTILTGGNTYSGGTSITHGTLQLGDGGTTGSIQGNVDIADRAALAFNRSDAQRFDGLISGSGQIRHIGSGQTTLTANSAAFTGTTTIERGTLAVNGSLCGGMNVGAGGRLQGTGSVCGTTNSGTVAPGNSIGTLTIAGNYVGAGGALEMETVLGGDNSPTDKLVVTGDTSGATNVRVINNGGAGAQTVEGIKLIDVGGNSAGAFSLVGDYVIQGQPAVVAGAYAYTLQKNGVSTPDDGDWYLRSSLVPSGGGGNEPQPPASGPLYQPGVPLYEAYPSVLLGLNSLSTLQERVGNQYGYSGNGATPSEAAGRYTRSGPVEGAWARVEGVNSRFEPKHSSTGITTHTDQYKIQVGVDHSLAENQSGRLVGGVNAQYGNASSSVDSFYGKGQIKADAYSLGTSLTWYGDNGSYVDGQAKLSWFSSTLSSRTLGRGLSKDNDGFGYALGVETGKRIGLGNGWGVTPQAQLQYSSVDFDSFTDPYGARVSLESGDSLLGRLGVAADHQDVVRDAMGKVVHRRSVYGIANLYYEMLDGTAVRVAGGRVASADDRAAAGLGAGATYSWADDKYGVYGEVMAKTSLANFGESYSYSGTVGLRVRY
ncbi:Autotransporter domain-containing protein [Bordetella tumbae]|uniref:autotransporter-associated beta strand repeat-containing protein n=1 Tax=Bordetella tumbae TaxID=1649139 RepID=UPI0039F049A2